MAHLLSEAGRSFLRAFVGSLLILLPGVLASPNFATTRGLAIAALIASVTAGIKAIQVFVPQLTFEHVLNHAYAAIADSFARAFLGSLLVLLPGVLSAPDFSTGKGLFVAALIAAVTAGVRALQGFLTPGDVPAPQTGLVTPDQKVAPNA
jgi:hypothetical protein